MAFREASLLDLRGTFPVTDLNVSPSTLFGDGHYYDTVPIDEEHMIIHTDTSVFLYAHSTREKLWEIICPSDNFAIHLPHNLLALAPNDRTIMLWDLCTGQLVHQLAYTVSETAFALCPSGLAFNHDGSLLAVGMEADGPVTNQNTSISEEILFLDDESPIATPVVDFENEEISLIILWDTSDGHVRQTISMTAYDADITALTFHPSGSLLAVGSFNHRTVWLWNLDAEKLMKQWNGAESRILQLLFSPDGTHLFIAADTNLYIWDFNIDQDVTPSALRSIHSGRIAIDPSGRFFATTDSTVISHTTIHILEINSLKMLYTCTGGLDNPCFSRDGRLLGFIAIDRRNSPQVYLMNVKTGKVLWDTRKKKTFFCNEKRQVIAHWYI